ncbi:MAG: prepilin-type N-terminal cleavage/methylation domain-containing protein, partial [Planctomycetota bacterium]
SPRGFAMMELLAVLLIFALMVGIVGPRIGDRAARDRDSQRLLDAGIIVRAIEQYRDASGDYPANDGSGWSSSAEADFLSVLVQQGHLDSIPHDPINDDSHQYRYYRYSAGSYGCSGEGNFFILGIRNFETEDARAEVTKHFNCSDRNWGDEFDYVTGGGQED